MKCSKDVFKWAIAPSSSIIGRWFVYMIANTRNSLEYICFMRAFGLCEMGIADRAMKKKLRDTRLVLRYLRMTNGHYTFKEGNATTERYYLLEEGRWDHYLAHPLSTSKHNPHTVAQSIFLQVLLISHHEGEPTDIRSLWGIHHLVDTKGSLAHK